MFNGVFEDILLGKMLLQYKIYTAKDELDLQLQISKIKKDLKQFNIYAKSKFTVEQGNLLVGDLTTDVSADLADLEFYLNNMATIEHKSSYNLNPKGTNFNSEIEEDYYKYEFNVFYQIIKKLSRLNICYLLKLVLKKKNADGSKFICVIFHQANKVGYNPEHFLITELSKLGDGRNLNNFLTTELNQLSSSNGNVLSDFSDSMNSELGKLQKIYKNKSVVFYKFYSTGAKENIIVKGKGKEQEANKEQMHVNNINTGNIDKSNSTTITIVHLDRNNNENNNDKGLYKSDHGKLVHRLKNKL